MRQLHTNPRDGHPSNHQNMRKVRKISQLKKFPTAERKPGHVKKAQAIKLMMLRKRKQKKEQMHLM